jgi:hypothetical protein
MLIREQTLGWLLDGNVAIQYQVDLVFMGTGKYTVLPIGLAG